MYTKTNIVNQNELLMHVHCMWFGMI